MIWQLINKIPPCTFISCRVDSDHCCVCCWKREREKRKKQKLGTAPNDSQVNFDLSVVLLEFLNLSALSHHDETKSFGIDFYYYFMSPYHLLFARLPLKKLFALLELLLTAHQSSNCLCFLRSVVLTDVVVVVVFEMVEKASVSDAATFEDQAAWRGFPIVVTCSQHVTSFLCLISCACLW